MKSKSPVVAEGLRCLRGATGIREFELGMPAVP